VSEHPVANAAIHIHGKISRPRGPIQPNFTVSLLWPIASPQSQRSKPIELKFGTKEHKTGSVLHAKFCPDRRRGGWVSKPPNHKLYLKNWGFRVDVWCQVRDYVPIMLKFGTKQYVMGLLSHAKFEPTRWQGFCTGATPKFTLLVRFGVLSVLASTDFWPAD